MMSTFANHAAIRYFGFTFERRTAKCTQTQGNFMVSLAGFVWCILFGFGMLLLQLCWPWLAVLIHRRTVMNCATSCFLTLSLSINIKH